MLYISVTGQVKRPYLDPSTRYRCFYAAEAARSFGHRSFVTTQERIGSVDPANYDVIVVHRPAWSQDLVRLVRAARKCGCRLVADYDDLIFDPAYATQSSQFVKSQDYTWVLAVFERNTDALRLFDEFTVSTKPLREHILRLHPTARVTILSNAVSANLWATLSRRNYERQEERPFLGYFPGTATHDKDFRVAAEGIANFCRERSVPFCVVGPLHLEPALFDKVEVVRETLQPFETMFDLLAKCKVVVAPLSATPFNQAKSHIKLLEANLACTSCVASAIPDMVRHRSIVGSSALVDDAPASWYTALSESWDAYSVAASAERRDRITNDYDARAVYVPFFEEARS